MRSEFKSPEWQIQYKNKEVLSYLCAGVLCVAVQISKHVGERVNIRIDFGVIGQRLFRTTVLNVE